MTANTFDQQFEALLRRYIRFIIRDIKTSIQKARDKEHSKRSTKEWVEDVLSRFRDNETLGDFCEAFVICYKEGEEIRESFIEIHKAFLKRASESLNPSYEELPKKVVKTKFPIQILLLKTFLRYLAFYEVNEKYDEIVAEPLISITESNSISNPTLNWTNLMVAKENKNDFVQLIYALHQAGFINHGRGEITKIVEAAADAFNVRLGNNWQSNHSASIHKAKRDYEPPIFHKIQEAYKRYTDELIAEKRKRR